MRQSKAAPLFGAIISGMFFATLAVAEGPPLAILPAAVVLPPSPGLPAKLPPGPEIPQAPVHPVAVKAPDDAASPGLLPGYGPLGLPCSPTLTAEQDLGATVRLRLEAACAPSGKVSVTHGALSADYILSSSGVLDTVFPAMQDNASFEAMLPNGQVLSASVTVPEAAGYERYVVMWSGDAGLSINAFEFGATRGEMGHVWRGAARAPTVADAGRGGYLLALGDAAAGGSRAEVYSFPASTAARSGAVRIDLGAEVTAATCGRTAEVTTLQIGDGLPGAPVDLSYTFPECGGADGYILLKNLARDLKIAAN